jgi:RNA polymerase sigma-70 factor (ECF subfamily)
LSSRPLERFAPVTDAPDEKQLVLAFKNGDSGAYDAIHARYGSRIESVCRRMLGNQDDAKEATQETFLRVYQALPRFNGRYQLGAWVARIATNVCLDQLRSKSRRPGDNAPLELIDAETSAVSDLDPELISIRRAESRRVRKVLASLPPMHRAAIVLRDFEGFTYEEVATSLGITDVQVKALIHRARQGFKRSWTSVASAFLPARLVQRLKDVDTSRDHAVHALTPFSQAASSCSAAIQQCGQYVADKVAAVVMVTVVGAAGVTGAVASTPKATDETAPVSTLAPSPEVEAKVLARPETRVQRSQESQSETTAAQPDDKAAPLDDKAAPPSEPLPAASPSPAATPSPASSPTPPPEGEPKPDPKPSPTPEPSPSSTEPAPFAPAMGFDRGSEVAPAAPWRHDTRINCGASTIEQRISTTLSDGKEALPAYVYLEANSTGSFEVSVKKQNQMLYYAGASSNVSVVGDRPGVLTFSFSGDYAERGTQSAAVDLPSSGTFTASIQVDCATSEPLEESLILSTNSTNG